MIRDPAQLGTLVSPVRHQVLKSLIAHGGASARVLGARLRRSPESLYYHLRALVDAGLVREQAAPESERGEAVFEAVAETVVTDPKSRDPEYLAAYQKSVSSMIRLADRQFCQVLERSRAAGSARPPGLRALQLEYRLSPADAQELARRIDALFEFLAAADDPEGSEAFMVTALAIPLPMD